MRGLIPSNMLLELPTKEFNEPQLISYAPGRPLSRGTFPPCPHKPPRFTLCSANNHIYIVIYGLLLTTSPQLSPEEPSSVTSASSTPTKERQGEDLGFLGSLPRKASRQGPSTRHKRQRTKAWAKWGANPCDFFFPRGKDPRRLVARARLMPFPPPSSSQPVPGCCSVLAHVPHSQLQLFREGQSALENLSSLPSEGSSLIISS